MPSLDYVHVELDSERRKRDAGKNLQETITRTRRAKTADDEGDQ
jgi:hypothetical protein